MFLSSETFQKTSGLMFLNCSFILSSVIGHMLSHMSIKINPGRWVILGTNREVYFFQSMNSRTPRPNVGEIDSFKVTVYLRFKEMSCNKIVKKHNLITLSHYSIPHIYWPFVLNNYSEMMQIGFRLIMEFCLLTHPLLRKRAFLKKF